ncbi:uncharacterized protein LOC133843347 [Drosophila sulfurigaster albostrigata]|uniref:uncharacterized protein LOC133843347 n=1 Tax=Drosophila sulfurigaster albostrigata TaxID=89887 RepID=UPI002D21BF39|nr:uncharacterized protein LOC133843347 [Drosophila sulfurigaster albostrigata]
MAFRETQSAIVINSLIADLVHEAIEKRLSSKDPINQGPCQKLYDILGIAPCHTNDEDIDVDIECTVKTSNTLIPTLGQIHPQSDRQGEQRCQWHKWLLPTLAEDSSGDELEIYLRSDSWTKNVSDIACQTEQPRFRKRLSPSAATNDRALSLERAPCEMNRQTIFIDGVSVQTPNIQSRPPLSDRFCYMLTDFASALYCSLAIMCCCTPSMFR